MQQGWASNFGRSLLDLDIFRDRVVLEYLTIEYPTRHFADALDRSSFTRFHLIFRVKWKSRVKLDFTRFYLILLGLLGLLDYRVLRTSALDNQVLEPNFFSNFADSTRPDSIFGTSVNLARGC